MVHINDPRGRWCVSAAQVRRIAGAAEWGNAPATDVMANLGALPGERHRVLVVRGAGGREIALTAAGPLEISEVDPVSVLPLPVVLAAAVPQISAIVVAPDGSLSLLIEPSAVITSGATVVGEELCPSHS
jgi:hypothetical protein